MDPISPAIVSGYADLGVLGLTVLVLIGVSIHLWRAREADRKAFETYREKADGYIAELQEKRITEQAKVIEAMNKSAGINELLGGRMDALTDAFKHGGR